TLEGHGGAWGYVRGGVGEVSAAIAAAAEAAGAALVCGAKVARVLPGEGVLLEDGSRITSRSVVSNADPRTTLGMCENAPAEFRDRVEAWRMQGPVLKINCALRRLPAFTAAGEKDRPHRSMVTVARSLDDTQQAYAESRRGTAAPRWAELYFHSAYDSTVAPPQR